MQYTFPEVPLAEGITNDICSVLKWFCMSICMHKTIQEPSDAFLLSVIWGVVLKFISAFEFWL
jgi:hypothetical protein